MQGLKSPEKSKENSLSPKKSEEAKSDSLKESLDVKSEDLKEGGEQVEIDHLDYKKTVAQKIREEDEYPDIQRPESEGDEPDEDGMDWHGKFKDQPDDMEYVTPTIMPTRKFEERVFIKLDEKTDSHGNIVKPLFRVLTSNIYWSYKNLETWRKDLNTIMDPKFTADTFKNLQLIAFFFTQSVDFISTPQSLEERIPVEIF